MMVVGCVCAGLPKANAGGTDTLTVTVTLAEIVSVSVDVDTWAIGAKALSETALSAEVTALNDGNVVENFAVKGADGAGAWVLGAAAGADTFALGFDTSAPYETFVPIDKTGVAFAASVAVDASQTFEMQYSMPTSDTYGPGVAQGFTITVTASKTP